MLVLYTLLVGIFVVQVSRVVGIVGCQFVRAFYQKHSTVFKLDSNQTALTVQPFYALAGQMSSTLSVGLIYHLADVHVVPVPLLFQCPGSTMIRTPMDCEFTILDRHADAPHQASEPTRTATVPLRFQEYSSLESIPLQGAYFKQSTIALGNCRLSTEGDQLMSEVFHLRVDFEQMINASCRHACNHPQLYECSSSSNTCQCRSSASGIDKVGQYCVDTELGSNCSLSPERCRRICRSSEHIQSNQTDFGCQCPLGTQRVLSNNMYHCHSLLSDCDNDKRSLSCPSGSICRQQRCLQVSIRVRVNESIFSFLPLILIVFVASAFVMIMILTIGLIKMRSARCIESVHPCIVSTHSSSSMTTVMTRLSFASSILSAESTNITYEKYARINFYG